MKIEKSTVTKLTITGAPSLDPITVYAEDIGPRKGKITIECYGQSWSASWGGMGDQTIAQFFCSCNEGYIAGNLKQSIQSNIVDADSIKDGCKKQIIIERRKRGISAVEARDLYDEVDGAQVGDDGWSDPNLMQRVFGDEWWYSLPNKPNPDYQYLCRIICAVQEALQPEKESAEMP